MRRPIRHLIGAAALLVGAAVVPSVAAGSAPKALDDTTRLNQIQVIGTHNSYHQLATDKERSLRRQFLGDAEDEFEYYHRALPVQFQSEKVREIELDVFNDAKGGLYSKPLIRQIAGEGPYDDAVMDQPGDKVLHAQDVDYHSTCLTFISCLTEVKTWSDANPTHVPIAILVELKDDIIDTGGLTFVHPEPFGPASLDHLDSEIRSVFAAGEMITPDDVRGGHTTLEDAVTTDGWPTLGQSRGKVMFLMDNKGHYRTDYLAGHASLQGRVLFTNADPGDDDAAFVERNDPKDPSIPGLASAGYVVRTRSDVPAGEAVTNDHSSLDAALASGAQWISTDYPVPGYSDGYGSGYFAEIPGGVVARCNPVNGPQGCVDANLDTIFTPAARPAGIAPVPTSTTTTSSTVPADTPAPPATPVDAPATFTG